MKLSILTTAALLALPAHADVWSLYKGTAIVKPRVDYSTLDLCSAAAPVAGKGYTCRASIPVPLAAPIDHTMHAGIPVSLTGWPQRTIEIKYGPLFTTGNPVPPLQAKDDEGAVREVCGFAKYLFDDPIVFPGQPGASHHHTFYGNAGANAFTTVANIRDLSNGSTCRGGTANLTAYWHVSLIDTVTGIPLMPRPMIIYYKTGISPYVDPRQTPIEPLPVGLRFVVGNAGASAPTDNSPYGWSCFQNPLSSNGIEAQQGQTIPSCNPGEWLRLKVTSKQCWNGKTDSLDHKSHMTDAIRVSGYDPKYDPYHPLICPDTHPHMLPVITEIIQWEVPVNVSYSNLRLASDVYKGPPGYSAHIDWFNGWDPEVSDMWSKKCHLERRECGSFTDGNGRNAVEWDGN